MKRKDILSLLNIEPSPQSADYVQNKKQFQLHMLLTEQRHSKTWNLSFVLKNDIEIGLKKILAVDKDVADKCRKMAENPVEIWQAANAVSEAIKNKRKIFIYGCGSTGRLAKQMESAIWRPFWEKLKRNRVWPKIMHAVPGDIQDRLIGEMTGGDRALISALEGFEDLQLVGRLQLQDRAVEKGDVVFGITEGGETSSVIGVISAALELYGAEDEDWIEKARNHLYFIYNNPDDTIRPLTRSRQVIENTAITKINLTTGPQAITGSTRMQAATSETFLMGIILEAGIHGVLKEYLAVEELKEMGFPEKYRLDDRLRSFENILSILNAAIPDIARFTKSEFRTYKNNKFATYFAKKALLAVFIDCAERSPTFHLYPLDTTQEKQQKCWFQVWTEGRDGKQAWRNFLGRDFRGLDEDFYKPAFLSDIDDDYLKQAAMKSLSQAGNDQEKRYDLSFSARNIRRRGPREGDQGVLVCMDEEMDELERHDSSFHRFLSLLREKKSRAALILIGNKNSQEFREMMEKLPLNEKEDVVVPLAMGKSQDPLNVNKQTLLKILLNTHSTAVMALMGKVLGNTMTNVNPSNLKLIGRATYLIMSHVNDAVSKNEWARKWGKADPVSYKEANAVLWEAMEYVAEKGGQISEVELSIIRILEALRSGTFLGWDEAFAICEETGLEEYLKKHNPALSHYQKS
jgi:N-acetylmuramic acid 6-phosphate etherase